MHCKKLQSKKHQVISIDRVHCSKYYELTFMQKILLIFNGNEKAILTKYSVLYFYKDCVTIVTGKVSRYLSFES